ncbi:EsaB/YukD family protein [Streptomyces sp. NPDC059788]|uniref:EsaB/YukD family protein n=1 Tax=Streptomyces sp. NPDC059788 TaxID=3346948 RepID=UPI003661660F
MVSAGAGQRVALRRVVLAGERRRVDLVLPAHEPVGALLPEVLRAIDDGAPPERAESGPAATGRTAPELLSCRLVTAGGAVLAQGETLASANVADGSVLRLVREHGTPGNPPRPVAAGGAPGGLGVYARRWDERSRTSAAVVAAVLSAAVAGVFAGAWFGPERAGLWLAVAAFVTAGAGAAVGSLLTRRTLGTALLLMGGALGVLASWDVTPGGAPRLAAVGLTVAVVLALLGLCTGLGRGGLVGAAAVAVGVWEAALAVADPARAGVAVGVVSVLVLGYLPRLALASAGLTRLDDRHSGGTPVSRYRAAAALGATHRGLTPAAVTVAVSAGAAGLLAAGGAADASGAADGWTVAAAVLLCVVLFSRARAYPLVLEVVALLAAGAAVCVRLAALWASGGGSPAGALTVLCLLAVLPLAALAVRLPERVRPRLRRLLDLAETVGVVALIPVALGVFGAYGGLLRMF